MIIGAVILRLYAPWVCSLIEKHGFSCSARFTRWDYSTKIDHSCNLRYQTFMLSIAPEISVLLINVPPKVYPCLAKTRFMP